MFGTKIRRHTEDGLVAQQTLAAIEEAMAVIEFNTDGTVIRANDNFLAVVGYTAAEVVGRSHRIFVDPSYATSEDYRAFWKDIGEGHAYKGEVRRYDSTGRVVWLEASYCPIKDAAGRIRSVVKFAFDITRKKNEVSRLLTMIDAVPVAVMTVDPKDDFRINYINATSLRTLGSIESFLPIKVSDMMGASIDVFHRHPEHQRRMLANDAQLPYSTKIRIGPETLRLDISAIKDETGTYVGPMLTWAVVTAEEQIAGEVASVSDALLASSQVMTDSSRGLRESAETASEEAASAAAGAQQMTGAIREIATQVTSVSDRANQIADQAQATDQQVKTLADDATKVDTVVSLIKSIATQTNLLALNATIEAARAGDAGKGFAVVASEVKALAQQTSKATDEIIQRVAAIQASSQGAVQSVEEISKAVAELSGLTTSMAGAMEEQSATTQQMSANIGGVSRSAQVTGDLAGDVQSTASALADHAASMKANIEKFIGKR